jgi:oxygen-independent coproporphyrinogen-3 oxidase
MSTKLIKEAERIIQDLNIQELYNKGIRKGRKKYTEYTTFYGYYPLPYYEMFPIKEEKIFSSFRKSITEKKVILYMHLPFCPSKCPYCYYYSLPGQSLKLIDTYISALKKELERILNKISPGHLSIKSLHLGGGTPTYLSQSQLEDLIGYLKERLDIMPGTKIACETRPNTVAGVVGGKKLEVLLKSGVNHLDIGIQAFDDTVLKEFGRGYDVDTAIIVYNKARELGFIDINIDLLTGFPGQMIDNWEYALDMIAQLRPNSISFYRLVIKTPMMHKKYICEAERFPNERDLLLFDLMAMEKLRQVGYYLQGPGLFTLSLPREDYPEAPEVISIGPSAWSYFNNIEYYNYFGLDKYLNQVERGRLPIWVGLGLSKERLMRREVIFRLKNIELGLDKENFVNRFGIKIEDKFYNELKCFKNLGLLIEQDGRIKLSLKGKLFTDEVFRVFSFGEQIEKFIGMKVINIFLLRTIYFKLKNKNLIHKLFFNFSYLLKRLGLWSYFKRLIKLINRF